MKLRAIRRENIIFQWLLLVIELEISQKDNMDSWLLLCFHYLKLLIKDSLRNYFFRWAMFLFTIISEEMRETVTNQIRKNLKYWQDEIPKEVFCSYKACVYFSCRNKERIILWKKPRKFLKTLQLKQEVLNKIINKGKKKSLSFWRMSL